MIPYDIIKAGELSMEYMTPISAYLHYFERCNPVRRILNDHCQSVRDVKELLRMTLSQSVNCILRDMAYL